MTNITLLGIDLAKNVFQLHGTDKRGKVVLQKKLKRNKLVEFVTNMPICEIVMEACGVEFIGNTIYKNHEEAKQAIFDYIEVFYNKQRRHSTLGYTTPQEYENIAIAA